MQWEWDPERYLTSTATNELERTYKHRRQYRYQHHQLHCSGKFQLPCLKVQLGMGKPGLCTRWFFFWEQYFALHISMNKWKWAGEDVRVLNVSVGLPSKQLFWGLCQPQYSICVDVNSILFTDLSQTFQHIAQLDETNRMGKFPRAIHWNSRSKWFSFPV